MFLCCGCLVFFEVAGFPVVCLWGYVEVLSVWREDVLAMCGVVLVVVRGGGVVCHVVCIVVILLVILSCTRVLCLLYVLLGVLLALCV